MESTPIQENKTQNTKNQPVLLLDGPYSKDAAKDNSFSRLDPNIKQVMEIAKDVSTQMINYQKKSKDEYKTLNRVTLFGSDTRVPGLKILDAAYVKTPYLEDTGLMIACDGYSMDQGIFEFWTMIIQENVKVITSFNEAFGRDNRNWCDVYKYFPDEKDGHINIGSKYTIKLQSDETKKTKSMTFRYLQVLDSKTAKLLHKVSHIHYHAWEDFDVPENEALDDLMSILQLQANMLYQQVERLHYQGETYKPERILMHCLAGRGRTGTALSIINSIMTLEGQLRGVDEQSIGEMITADQSGNISIKNLNLSIFSIVRRLREQRATAVQTSSQYLYIYQFIDAWLQKKTSSIVEKLKAPKISKVNNQTDLKMTKKKSSSG